MSRDFKPYPFIAARHDAVLPRLSEGVDARRRPVVVVGAGPVGYCTALGPARHGVPVVLVEADDGVCFGSRSICISRRSLEIIERLGALPCFLAAGRPWTGGCSCYRDTEVLQLRMPQDENQRLPPMVNLAQYSIEQLLLQQAEARRERIDIRWQTRVTAVDARDDGVRLTVTTPQGDYAIDADWVAAADGGRSFVRESLGLQLQGTSYEGRYVIVDILMDSARPTERLAYFDPPCNPGSTVLVHKQPDHVWRIDYQLRDGEDPDAAIRPENVEPRVASLLAIFGVRGANSGIDDADNLAWKLAYVVRGLASEQLLDSYSEERVDAAHENLGHGTKSTEFMAPPSFAFKLMREAVLGLAVKHAGVRSLINPRQTSAIAYRRSRLNAAAGASAAFGAGPAPGTVLPECPLTVVHDGSPPQRVCHRQAGTAFHGARLRRRSGGAGGTAGPAGPARRRAPSLRAGACRPPAGPSVGRPAGLGPQRPAVPDVWRRRRHAVPGALRRPCGGTLAPGRRRRGARSHPPCPAGAERRWGQR